MKKVAAVIVFPFIFSIFLSSQDGDIVIIKDPKPTCVEKVYTELKKVGEVVDTMESKAFLIAPQSVTADGEGNIYVYDSMMKKIYKYDRDLNVLFTFSGEGQGPGEIGASRGRGGDIFLHLAKDNLLYAGDRANQKIIAFNASGKPVHEIKIYIRRLSHIVPVVDSKGNFYIHSTGDGVIDVYNREGDRVSSLIDNIELAVGLFYSLKREVMKNYYYRKPSPTNISYDMIDGDRLLVYLQSSGMFFIVKDSRVIKKLKLWPRDALKYYKEKFKEGLERDPEFDMFTSFFFTLIVDRDDKRYFYLQFGKPKGSNKNYLYKFDLDGNLIKVLFINEPSKNSYEVLNYKRNGLFYGVGFDEEHNKNLKIYKEETK